MNIYMNRSPIFAPWGGGTLFVNAFTDIMPELGHTLLKPSATSVGPDVIVLAAMDAEKSHISAEQAIMHKVMNEKTKVVLRVNENDARKNTNTVDAALVRLSGYVDGTVFVSDWLESYFMERGWKCKNNTVIINGVDPEHFAPGEKINNGKINIVTHHWSNNEMKGFDIYDKLDEFVGTPEGDDFTFTYIGRHRDTFKNANVISPMKGKELGDELKRYNVYVSASRWDPGPNHITESIACDIPTYVHVDGGGAVEFAGADHVFSDWDSLKALLLQRNFVSNSNHIIRSWKDCISEYNGFIEAICKI